MFHTYTRDFQSVLTVLNYYFYHSIVTYNIRNFFRTRKCMHGEQSRRGIVTDTTRDPAGCTFTY